MTSRAPPSVRPGTAPVGSFWAEDLDELFVATGSGRTGLAAVEAARRWAAFGSNSIGAHRGHRGARLLAAQYTSPIILILAAATVL